MTRRSLFKRLAGLVAVGTVAPYVKPLLSGFKYSSRNTLLSIEDMNQYYLRPSAITTANSIDTEFLLFDRKVKIGDTINIRKPHRFIGRT